MPTWPVQCSWSKIKLTLSPLKLGLSAVLAFAQVGHAERLEPYRCGSVLEEAKCLLRSVFQYGKLGEPLAQIPAPLDDLIGRPVVVNPQTFRSFIAVRGIAVSDLGGNLFEPLSKTLWGDFADYFVIHDTSTPVYQPNEEFPATINELSWNQRLLQALVRNENAHVFIDRTGSSKTAVGFASPLRTTVFEKLRQPARRGLFLGIELIQPRKLDRRGIDATAPNPGFTEPQLDRLALTYIAASVRRGQWMIPAFHAAVDAGLPNAHDDPQNFDLKLWAQRVRLLLDAIVKQ
jgi:hypothetical protein